MRLCAAGACLIAALILLAGGLASCVKQDPAVNIGVLAREDALPLWVADQEGYLTELGMDYSLEVFDSEVELISALTAGKIEYAVTDPVIAIKAFSAGSDVRIEWIALGRQTTQDRYGLITLPPPSDSETAAETGSVAEAVEALTSTPHKTVASMKDLVDARVGVATSTIDEYLLEEVLTAAGIDPETVIFVDEASAADALEALEAETVDAALLPFVQLSQAQAAGMVALATNSEVTNTTTSVLISRTAFLEKEGGERSLDQLREAWERAAMWIAYYPTPSSELLAEKTGMPADVAEEFVCERYPVGELPPSSDIDAIIAWMRDKEYLTVGISYDETTGELAPDLEE